MGGLGSSVFLRGLSFSLAPAHMGPMWTTMVFCVALASSLHEPDRREICTTIYSYVVLWPVAWIARQWPSRWPLLGKGSCGSPDGE